MSVISYKDLKPSANVNSAVANIINALPDKKESNIDSINAKYMAEQERLISKKASLENNLKLDGTKEEIIKSDGTFSEKRDKLNKLYTSYISAQAAAGNTSDVEGVAKNLRHIIDQDISRAIYKEADSMIVSNTTSDPISTKQKLNELKKNILINNTYKPKEKQMIVKRIDDYMAGTDTKEIVGTELQKLGNSYKTNVQDIASGSLVEKLKDQYGLTEKEAVTAAKSAVDNNPKLMGDIQKYQVKKVDELLNSKDVNTIKDVNEWLNKEGIVDKSLRGSIVSLYSKTKQEKKSMINQSIDSLHKAELDESVAVVGEDDAFDKFKTKFSTNNTKTMAAGSGGAFSFSGKTKEIKDEGTYRNRTIKDVPTLMTIGPSDKASSVLDSLNPNNSNSISFKKNQFKKVKSVYTKAIAKASDIISNGMSPTNITPDAFKKAIGIDSKYYKTLSTKQQKELDAIAKSFADVAKKKSAIIHSPMMVTMKKSGPIETKPRKDRPKLVEFVNHARNKGIDLPEMDDSGKQLLNKAISLYNKKRLSKAEKQSIAFGVNTLGKTGNSFEPTVENLMGILQELEKLNKGDK